MGKAFLSGASDPEAEIRALGALKRYTPNTLTDKRQLLDDVQLSAQRGYAIDDEEQLNGVRCVGAPIFDKSGRARAAFAIQGPSVHLSHERVAEVGGELPKFARRLATAMRLG